MQVVPFYDLLGDYQISGMSRNQSGISGIQVSQEYMSTVDSGHCIYIIHDNKYSVPVNEIITGQVLICQEASDKSCHNKKQVSSGKSGVR